MGMRARTEIEVNLRRQFVTSRASFGAHWRPAPRGYLRNQSVN